MWEIAKKLSIIVLTVSLVLSLGNQSGEETSKDNDVADTSSSSFSILVPPSFFMDYSFVLSNNDMKITTTSFKNELNLEYDFYRDTCPQAEQIVRSIVRYLYKKHSKIAPALLRLVFHDCFIQIEDVCPATVSCADILVLAAREGIAMAGGPYYPLYTGRRDSLMSFPEVGFFHNRLYNFAGSGGPDPSLEPGFLNQMRSRWFVTHYYKRLVEGKGILHAVQQLMASEATASWVQTYSLDGPLFQRDFAQVMIKLSSLRVLTSPLGQIRLNCSMVSSEGL
ncbi:hypothetical protein IFM89_029794 [Coptis chinensis]|uniref:Plant heme peroxidase family profile domain-containing protein n=1 Tax=Coptis chinensis TaxID=261450 RepID=A0A835IHF2_9MAGN|nr:hypothetical protein IFM89_029794 [Coptis chinensis]